MQHALAALGLPHKKLVRVPSDLASLSSHGTGPASMTIASSPAGAGSVATQPMPGSASEVNNGASSDACVDAIAAMDRQVTPEGGSRRVARSHATSPTRMQLDGPGSGQHSSSPGGTYDGGLDDTLIVLTSARRPESEWPSGSQAMETLKTLLISIRRQLDAGKRETFARA